MYNYKLKKENITESLLSLIAFIILKHFLLVFCKTTCDKHSEGLEATLDVIFLSLLFIFTGSQLEVLENDHLK